MISIIFYILAALTLGTAALTVLSRNPVHSAMYMIACFFTIAGHMLMLNAMFLAVVQILVYTGAIMVLLLFTLMLMNLGAEHEPKKKIASKIAAIIAAGLTALVLLAIIVKTDTVMVSSGAVADINFQTTEVIGQVLLNEYLIPFEFTTVLLIVAMVGAVMISKQDKKA